jgi:hypothetical protein
MPRPEELPEDIRALTERQARSLADRSTHRRLDLAELVADIERATGEVASVPVGPPTRRSRLTWVGGLTILAASLYIGRQIAYRHWTWSGFWRCRSCVHARAGSGMLVDGGGRLSGDGSNVRRVGYGLSRGARTPGREVEMSRLRNLLFVPLIGVLIPGLCQGQAGGIARPMTVPDSVWIERQCADIEEIEVTDDAVEAGMRRARQACVAYRASAHDATARDAWVRAMLEIQDDVGPAAMRDFIPQFGAELPEGLDTYSLFLIPDARWQDSEFADERTRLWETFHSFGRSIGDRHAAIWFLDQEDNVDVLRSQEYCRRFNLSWNDGPYLVTVAKRPDLLERSDEVIVVRMGGIAPDRILTVLNRLSSDLTSTGTIATGPLVYEELKQRVLSRVDGYGEGVRAFLSSVFEP